MSTTAAASTLIASALLLWCAFPLPAGAEQGLPAAEHTDQSGPAPSAAPRRPHRRGSNRGLHRRCTGGSGQSPIDFRAGRVVDLPPISFRYRSSPLSLSNENGILRIHYDSGSHLLQDGRRRALERLELRIPGEHRFYGQTTDMEIQFHHRDGQGHRTILAVPVVAGRRGNNMLERIARHLPAVPGERNYQRNVGINATFLLPVDRSYYTYTGSLTSPPCTPGVRWIVFRSPLEVEGRHIEQIRRIIGVNARPTQPLGGRPVLISLP